MIADHQRNGKSPKTIRNVLSTLHSIFGLAIRRRWVASNPCRLVDRPEAPEPNDIRFLSQEELESVLRKGVPDDDWGALRTLWLDRVPGAGFTSASLLIDRAGRLRHVHEGGAFAREGSGEQARRDYEKMRDAVVAALAER